MTSGVRIDTERSIELDDADWAWATWRERAVTTPKPAKVTAFDLASVIERLRTKVVPIKNGAQWNFRDAGITNGISKEEARVWFELMLGIQRSVPPEKKAAELEKKRPKLGALSFTTAMQRILSSSYDPAPEIASVLATLFSAEQVTDLLVDDKPPSDGDSAGGNFFHGWRAHVLSLLDEKARAALKERIAPEIVIAKFATDPDAEPYEDRYSSYGMGSFEAFALDHFREPSGSFFAAAALGMHDELRAVVEGLADDSYRGERRPAGNNVPQLVIFGLGSADLVVTHMKRLKLRLDHPHWARAWLAHTEYAQLDAIVEAILATKDKLRATELAEVLALVRAPENVGPMLTLSIQSKAADIAEGWLTTNIGHTIQGCLALVTGSGVLANAATARLRLLAKDHKDLIDRLGRTSASGEAIALASHELPVLEALPASLKRPIEAGMKAKAKLASFVAPDALPPLEIGGKKLGAEHVIAMLRVFASEGSDPRALAKAVREHAAPASRDAFAWTLFEQWLLAGGPAKHKWVMIAMALLAGDACALKLAPLIREWPGKGLHQRAVLGLDVLGAIGTEAAIVQLSGLARTLYFPAAKQHAEAMMTKIARSRKLTRDELEDEIVPHGGFDANGKRTFVYGARTFEVVLGPEATPMLRDVDGGPRIADLPAAMERDDLVAAKRLREEWATLKRTLEETFKVQANRLEQSMVLGRRWSREAFERLLVRHPLMGHLARTLVWGTFDGSKVGSTFRVAEDGSLAGEDDDAFALPKKATIDIGIVHPMDLDPERRDRWGGIFADYEILPPFEQLGRPIRTTAHGEADDLASRFTGRTWATKELFELLRDRGWTHGYVGGGAVATHVKHFPGGGGVTACISHNVHYFSDASLEDVQEIHHVRFLSGLRIHADPFGSFHTVLPLRRVDPKIVSEVLYDLM